MEKDADVQKIDKSFKYNAKTSKTNKEWESKHPNWNEDDKETELYMTMVQQVMGSNDEEQIENIKRELGGSGLKEPIENS